MTLRRRRPFPESDTTTRFDDRRVDVPCAPTLIVRRPAWCTGMTIRVNGRRWNGTARASGYVADRREWRAGDRVEVRLPMTLRAEPLPGAPDFVAFVYGPIVLAGDSAREGVTPEAQIIVNERDVGKHVERADRGARRSPATAVTLVRRIAPVRGEPLTFETVGIGRPRDVKLAPFYRLAHERYNLYWKVAAGMKRSRCYAARPLVVAAMTIVDAPSARRNVDRRQRQRHVHQSALLRRVLRSRPDPRRRRLLSHGHDDARDAGPARAALARSRELGVR